MTAALGQLGQGASLSLDEVVTVFIEAAAAVVEGERAGDGG